MTPRRTPTCKACGDPLGSTALYCWQCIEDDSVDTSDDPNPDDWRENAIADEVKDE